jgi:hypothetical protein
MKKLIRLVRQPGGAIRAFIDEDELLMLSMTEEYGKAQHSVTLKLPIDAIVFEIEGSDGDV